MLLVVALGRDKDAAESMRATPGFHIFVFRVWALSLDQAQIESPLTLKSETEFEEAIEGSGGSIISLAHLCVSHLKQSIQSTTISAGMDASFRQALIDQGIVPVLTTSAYRLTSPPFADFFDLSWAIQYYFRTEFGHNIVTESLRAGLLRAVLGWGRASLSIPLCLDRLDPILTVLSQSLVYLSVLLQLRASIDELETPLDADTFQGLPVSEKWEAFWSLLQERWAFMKEYMARDKTAVLSACNSMACCVIGVKSEFQRCGLCRESKYCSRACQRHDWHQGGHRKTCSWTPENVNNTVSSRDRSFLRALLHEDYLKLRVRLLHDELVYLRSNPGSHFHYKFDYCTPYTGCEACIKPIHEFALDNDMWRHQDARSTASGGRVQTHVMRVGDGGCATYWLFPLCSAAVDRRIGVAIPAAEATVADEEAPEQTDKTNIKRLAELDILEIHV
ncbi:hypothetical protein C8F01DRAFT_1373524 [Mycena amicta]|nr:hypothetical protein C8F01DRAFT_1373524 [Mycena amicta]